MDWQQATALLIVAATAGLFLRAQLVARKNKFGAGAGHCGGCSGLAGAGQKQRIVLHARKGERRQVVVKSR